MKTVYADKNFCSGCGACRNTCPTGAISMCPDEQGLLYPVIDGEKCGENCCANCTAVCPMIWEGQQRSADDSAVYAAKHKSKSKSTLSAIADVVLESEGIVCGGDSVGTPDAYEDAIRGLREGKTVLFIGTPCQAAGMRALMKRKVYPQNLYICDTLCSAPMRPSCGVCSFAEGRRASDITVAGSAGKGIALILINSAKGQSLFEAAKENLSIYQRPTEGLSAEKDFTYDLSIVQMKGTAVSAP